MPNPVEQFIVTPRFCGPIDSGNGGYVCGKLANHLKGAVEVRLKKPPPLGEELGVFLVEEGRAELRCGEEVIAEAKSTSIDLEIPPVPSLVDAQAVVKSYLGFREHPFPSCFVCGPKRREGEGLRIFPGKVPGRGIVAAPWVADPSLEGEGGFVAHEFLWAALDCPGAFALLQDRFPPMVLGTLAVDIKGDLRIGERAVVIGWEIGREGRKRLPGTALFNEGGDLVACGKAVWIELEKKNSK